MNRKKGRGHRRRGPLSDEREVFGTAPDDWPYE
jgi:hypothetical protein